MMYYIFREDLVEWTDFISHNMDLEMINDSVDPFFYISRVLRNRHIWVNFYSSE